jgi:DNA-binding response OmpR family regulator
MTKKILIVDDEVNIVISLEFLMQQAGYQVWVAYNGEEGMALIHEIVPDLILLDIMLPGVNGYEICQQVRATPELAHIKIIMVTAKGREVEVAKGLALGADAYIRKPFSTQELMTEVQRAIGEPNPIEKS